MAARKVRQSPCRGLCSADGTKDERRAAKDYTCAFGNAPGAPAVR